MAPWSRTRKPEEEKQKPEDPARTFQKFADEQLSALVQGLNTIPGLSNQNSDLEAVKQTSEIASMRARLSKEFPDLFSSLLSSPLRKNYRGGPVSEEVRQATRVLLLQARNANVDTDPTKVLELYQDHGHSMVPVNSRLPIRTTTSNTTWLGIEWFRASPYSPVQLEQHDSCHASGTKWRAAFEDLLSASLNKPQHASEAFAFTASSKEAQAAQKAWELPGVDWMLTLQSRGILPPQLPSLYNITHLETEKLDRVFGKIVAGVSRFWTPYGAAVNEDFTQLARVVAAPEAGDWVVRSRTPETELDMYEDFAWKGDKETEKKTVKEDGDRVVAISTMTETRRLSDGSVFTKRLLKKRFADGREESKEEVENSGAEDEVNKDVESEGEGKGGWFWSG